MEMIIAELHDRSRTAFRRARVVFNAAQRLTGYDPEPSAEELLELNEFDSADKVSQAAREVHATAVHLKLEILSVAYLYPTEAAFNFRLNRVCDAAASGLHAQSLIAQITGENILSATLREQSKAVFAEADEYRRRGLELCK